MKYVIEDFNIRVQLSGFVFLAQDILKSIFVHMDATTQMSI